MFIKPNSNFRFPGWALGYIGHTFKSRMIQLNLGATQMYILHMTLLKFLKALYKFLNFIYILLMFPSSFFFFYFSGLPKKNFLGPPLDLHLDKFWFLYCWEYSMDIYKIQPKISTQTGKPNYNHHREPNPIILQNPNPIIILA